jgi:hypothetical protein
MKTSAEVLGFIYLKGAHGIKLRFSHLTGSHPERVAKDLLFEGL